jgi:hypothetical protein
MIRPESKDEELTRRLLAPPRLDDGLESLDYWRRRSRRLPWYRFRARREATRMLIRWEQRVGAAIVSHDDAPLGARLSAAGMVTRSRLARWTRRAGIAALATVTGVLMLLTVLVAAAVTLVLNAV